MSFLFIVLSRFRVGTNVRRQVALKAKNRFRWLPMYHHLLRFRLLASLTQKGLQRYVSTILKAYQRCTVVCVHKLQTFLTNSKNYFANKFRQAFRTFSRRKMGFLLYIVRNPSGDGAKFFLTEDLPGDGEENVVLFVDVIHKYPDNILAE